MGRWKNLGSLKFPLRHVSYLLLLLSRFSHVRLCATPQTAAYQAPPALGFSRQEHWSGLPFPSPMHESEKWKWSRSVMSDSLRPHGLQPTGLLRPWDFPGKSTGVGCHFLPHIKVHPNPIWCVFLQEEEIWTQTCTKGRWCEGRGNEAGVDALEIRHHLFK